jgi:predicted TIM-barrel fold metal-dependent hydrolase
MMRRRDFIAGSAALAAGATAAIPDWALAQSGSVPRIDRIIDAHCHIFNADDVPIEGYAKHIIVPMVARSNQLMARFEHYPGALRALIHALALQMKEGAPDGHAEIRKLDEIDSDPARRPTAQWRRSEDIRNLRGAFRRIWRDKETFRRLDLGQSMALEVAIESIQLFLVQQVYSEFGRPTLSPDDRGQLQNWPYDELATELYPRDDHVGRYIRWSLLFTRYRFELGDNLDQVQELSGKSRLALMTPASVDFSKWVEDESHSNLESQIAAMARVGRQKSGPRIHGFVGFDPLRQALHDRGRSRPQEKEPMELLRAAIEMKEGATGTPANWAGGSIGVKLYPPMGFRATGNEQLPDARFSDPGFLRSTERGLAPQIGVKLDRALNRLYQWCNDNNVPIMAHTNNSFGPSVDYEDRAHPEFWAKVLATYPKLRINMAHFGHFNKAVIHRDPKDHVSECWEWTIVEIMSLAQDSYAYADISSISEILQPGPSRKILECMKAFRENFKDSADRLMYGTDWSMIAQSENFPKAFAAQPYPDLMAKFLFVVGYTPGQIEGIMFRNATRFLGLSKSEHERFGDNCTRGRLEQFYAFHRLPADWMTAFD